MHPEKDIKHGQISLPSRPATAGEKNGVFWFCYFLVCLLAQVWPVYLIGNRIKPYLLGMPFSMFWIGLWIVIIFIGLVIKYNQEYRR